MKLSKTALDVAILLVAISNISFADTADERMAAFLPEMLVRKIATKGPGVPIVVFNPLSWTRTDAVNVMSPFDGESPNLVVVDSAGKRCPARNLADRLYFTARNVPPLGYKVFWVQKIAKPLPAPVICTVESIENQYFRVHIDKFKGVITSIYDKAAARQVMSATGYSALLQVVEPDKSTELKGDSIAVMMDSGPSRGLVLMDHGFNKCPFIQEVTLYDGVPRVDVRMTAEWRDPVAAGQSPAMLRVGFSTNLKGSTATVGSIDRSDLSSQLPSLKWIQYSQSGYSISLLLDKAYGADVEGGTLWAKLLRQDDAGQTARNGGVWESNYSLFANRSKSSAREIFRRAFELAEPLVARPVSKHAGEYPVSRSLVEVPAANICLVAMSQYSKDGSLALRAYDVGGKACKVKGTMNLPAAQIVETDLQGKALGTASSLVGGSFDLALGPHQSKSFTLLYK